MKAFVVFKKFAPQSQTVRASDPNQNHMVATIPFDLHVGEDIYQMSVDVQHPFGTGLNDDPVEVKVPTGEFKGNCYGDEFRDAVTDYCRECMGRGSGISFAPDAKNVTFTNCVIGTVRTIRHINLPE